MPYQTPLSLLGSTPITASGVGVGVNLGTLRGNGYPAATVLEQSITANADYSSTIAFSYETSVDGFNWTSTPIIAKPDGRGFVLTNLNQYVRPRWTVTGGPLGSPIVTRIDGVSKVFYASIADVAMLGLPPNAYGPLTQYEQYRLLESANGEADASIRMSYVLPLKDWGPELVQRVVDVFSFLVMRRRGVNPEPGAYDPFTDSVKQARKWFQFLAAGDVDPGIIDSSPTGAEGGALISTQPRRGWNTSGTI